MSDNQIYFLIPAFKTNINFVLNGFVSSDEVSELKKIWYNVGNRSSIINSGESRHILLRLLNKNDCGTYDVGTYLESFDPAALVSSKV